MREDGFRASFWRLLLAALMVIVLFGILVAVGAAADDDRLERKVAVMERVIDEVLVQSPNVVVDSREVTRGLVLDGYGVVFIFDAGLHSRLPWAGRAVIAPEGTFRWRSGSRARPAPEAPEAPEPPEAPGAPTSLEDAEVLSLEEWEEESAAKRAQMLEGLRAELVDTLLDYGPTLSELPDDAWVTIVAFLGDGGPFDREGPKRLSVKARMRELRSHSGGDLSRQDARAAVVVETR